MILKLTELDTPPEIYGAKRADEVNAIVDKWSEMHGVERAFVTGLLMRYAPRKVLELGVSAGGGSIVIANAIRDIAGAHLHSVDLFEHCYKDKQKPSGWMVNEFMPELSDIWTPHLGKDISEVADSIGEIDFLVLDTAHIHPVETINLLCALPYLKDGAVVVLHDISLHLLRGGYATASYACRLLFDSVAADKLTPKEKYAPSPNIGAFQISEDTRKYVYNLFSNLFLPWGRPYSKPWQEIIPPRLIGTYTDLFGRFYGAEYREMFQDACAAQDNLYKEVSYLTFVKILCGQFVRGTVKLMKGSSK